MSQAAPLVSMLPSMLAGVVGGAIGAVTSIPAAIAQQAQSAISQATQAAEGLAKGLSTPETPELDTSGLGADPVSFGDVGGGGGGGSTEPAGVSTSDLPPASGGMLAQAGPASPAAVSTGPSVAGPSAQAAGMAPGGMPPMMPPMAGGMGRGGGGTQPVKEPNKKVVLLVEPNSELVTGEVPRRIVAEADDVTNDHRAAARDADADAVVTSSRRRRVELPKDDES
jgi:hypothetical protein